MSDTTFKPIEGGPIEGGCLCGALRYRISMAPTVIDLCHCWQCRKASGAPFIAWIGVPAAGFAWIKGEPARFESSPNTWRDFCGRCGSPLAMAGGVSPGLLGVTVGSLDEPAQFTPTDEGWTSQRLPWARIAHPLTSHDEDHPGF